MISRDATAKLHAGDNVFTTSGGTSGTFQNEILLSGLNLPTAIKFLPNGDMLVLELGPIRRVNTATWTIHPTNFLTLTNIGTQNGQQGLMDLVLDPNFASNPFLHVFYTLGSPAATGLAVHRHADLTGTVAGSSSSSTRIPIRRTSSTTVVRSTSATTASTRHHRRALQGPTSHSR